MVFTDNKAIYLQIADYVYEQILLKQWSVDERIPSGRDLAAKFEVNPNTVARTYEHLQNQEIILNKRGVGFFVLEGALEKIRALRREEFIEKDLPLFFRNLYLLDIKLSSLSEAYETFVETTFSNHEEK